MIGRVQKWVDRANDRIRAEGVRAAGVLLRNLADSVVETDREDLRRGLLAASGFCSVLASALEQGGSEIGFVDIDGDAVSVDLTLRGPDGEEK